MLRAVDLEGPSGVRPLSLLAPTVTGLSADIRPGLLASALFIVSGHVAK